MTARVRLPKGEMRWPRTVQVGPVGVKIYKIAAATFASGHAYTLVWQTPEGRRQRKFSDPEEALREAKLVAGRLAAGELEAAGMTRGDFRELAAAREIAGEIPLLSALREWAKVRELTGGHALAAAESWAQRNNAKTFQRITVGDAIDRFISQKQKAGKQAERTYRSKLEPLRRHFGERTIDSISAEEFGIYLEQFQDGVTRNDFRKRAVALCRWAQASGFIPRGAALEIEATERASEAATEIGTLTPAQFRALLEWVRAEHPEHLAALVIAGFAAVRADEIHGKRADRERRQLWEDIDLERKHLNVSVAKKNTPSWRLVELPDAAVAWLMLCPNRTGPICEAGAMEKLRLLVRSAKLDNGEPRFAALPENGFRHSAISYRIALTGDKPGTATWAGNSVAEIDRRYRRPMTRQAAQEWFAIHPAALAEVAPLSRHASKS